MSHGPDLAQSRTNPGPPVRVPMEPPTEDPIPPLHHEHTGNLLKVLNHSIDILNAWSGLMWSTKWDQMCLAHLLSVLNRIATPSSPSPQTWGWGLLSDRTSVLVSSINTWQR
jgi:hypothetical protein